MSAFKAAFLDIDGVVVLSEPLHVEKITKTAQKYNIYLQQADWDELYGIGDHRVYLALKDRGLPISEDEFIDQTLTYYTENKHRLKVRDGFKAAFNMLQDKGLEIATVSSGVIEQVNANLDAADIRLKTKFNLSATDVVNKGLNTKPAPDAYLEALRMLNAQNGTAITPAQCLVIEDSGSGVKSGHAAGMHTIHWRLEKQDKISDLASSTAYNKAGLIKVLDKLLI